jgi:hypothetical protein
VSGNILRPGDGSAQTDAWTVQSTVDLSAWADGREPCSHCGASVALDEPHVAVQLVRPTDVPSPERKHTLEHRRLTFCDRTCARAWLDDRRDHTRTRSRRDDAERSTDS